jgi:hypothetical protein
MTFTETTTQRPKVKFDQAVVTLSLVPKTESVPIEHHHTRLALLAPVLFAATDDIDCTEPSDAAAPTEQAQPGLGTPNLRGGVLLAANKAIEVRNAQLAMDAHGNAIAVWEQHDGKRIDILANRYVACAGWGAAVTIETDKTGNAFDPQLSMSTDGDAMVAWRQPEGAGFNIWANRYAMGKGWSVAEKIEVNRTDSVWEPRSPRVCAYPGGNALVVWHQFDGTRNNIWAKRYVAGIGWAKAELIETNTSGHADRPQVACDARGNALVVWQQFDGMCSNIWANRYVAGKGWGEAVLIENGMDGGAFNPQIVLDASGKALAVWEQYDGRRWCIWASRFAPAVGWGAVEQIELNAAGHASNPQMSIDAGGNATVVWCQREGTACRIWANRYVAGSGWGRAEPVASDHTGAFDPQVSTDAQGKAMLVWWQPEGEGCKNIWASSYAAATGWGRAALLATNYIATAPDPQIITDTDGNAIAVWKQFDGARDNIWANSNR